MGSNLDKLDLDRLAVFIRDVVILSGEDTAGPRSWTISGLSDTLRLESPALMVRIHVKCVRDESELRGVCSLTVLSFPEMPPE